LYYLIINKNNDENVLNLTSILLFHLLYCKFEECVF